jgi:hypothetical protein
MKALTVTASIVLSVLVVGIAWLFFLSGSGRRRAGGHTGGNAAPDAKARTSAG